MFLRDSVMYLNAFWAQYYNDISQKDVASSALHYISMQRETHTLDDAQPYVHKIENKIFFKILDFIYWRKIHYPKRSLKALMKI